MQIKSFQMVNRFHSKLINQSKYVLSRAESFMCFFFFFWRVPNLVPRFFLLSPMNLIIIAFSFPFFSHSIPRIYHLSNKTKTKLLIEMKNIELNEINSLLRFYVKFFAFCLLFDIQIDYRCNEFVRVLFFSIIEIRQVAKRFHLTGNNNNNNNK